MRWGCRHRRRSRRRRPRSSRAGLAVVGERDTLGDEIVAGTDEGTQGARLVAQGGEGGETVPVRAQDVGEHVGIGGIRLASGGLVARPAGFHDVWMDRVDGMSCGEQGVHKYSRRAFDRDWQLARGSQTSQLAHQLLEPRRGMGRIEACPHATLLIDGADRVLILGPVQACEERHGKPPVVRVSVLPAGRSCRSLIVRRSELSRRRAQHPVAGRGLPTPPRALVSRGPSSGKRRRRSSKGRAAHRVHQ